MNANSEQQHSPFYSSLSSRLLSLLTSGRGLLVGGFLVFFLAALFYIPLLGVPEVFQVSEAREGVVVNRMLRTKEFVLPLRHGELIPSKPILFHWLNAGLRMLFPTLPAEMALRLPSALAAALCCMAVFCFGRLLVSASFACLSSFILATSYGFFRLATDGRVDMVFIAALTAALLLIAFAIIRATESQTNTVAHKLPFSLGCLLCGLAVLAKGPLAIALCGLVATAFAICERGAKGMRLAINWRWVFAVLLPLPWYIAAASKQGNSFLGRQIFFENVARMLGAEGIAQKPLAYYFPHLLTQGAPWTFILLFLSVLALFKDRNGKRRLFSMLESTTPQERRVLRIGLCWVLVMFVLFSAASGKRRAYLVTLLPGLSLVTAVFVRAFQQRFATWMEETDHQNSFLKGGVKQDNTAWRVQPKRIAVLVYVLLACVAGSLLFISALRPQPVLALFKPRSQVTLISIWPIFEQNLILIIFYSGLTLIVALWFWCRAWNTASAPYFYASVALFICGIYLVFVNLGLAVKGRTHGYASVAAAVDAVVPPSQPLTFIKRRRDESFDAFFYYASREISLHPLSKQPKKPGYYVSRKSWLESQDQSFLSRVEALHTEGRRVDADERKLVIFKLVAEPLERPA